MSKKISFDHPTLPFEEWGSGPAAGEGRLTQSRQLPTGAPTGSQVQKEEENIMYLSFGSGSSGNSCYVGTRNGGFIVDVGVRADVIETGLKANGIAMKDVKGILLTHDHSDHVRFAYTLLRNNRHLKLFCTNRVLSGLLRRHGISKRIKEYHMPIFKEIPFKMMDFEVTAFEVPHDGSDNMGFSMKVGTRNFVIATDLGAISERGRHYMGLADYLVIESNYDYRMLVGGRYPEYLKARIMNGNGHLDNRQTAEFLADIWTPRLKHIFLCHLSKDNNTPLKAMTTTREALEARGLRIGRGENTLNDRTADVQLSVLPRYDTTPLYVFRPELRMPGM